MSNQENGDRCFDATDCSFAMLHDQSWYREQRPRWDAMIFRGWKFSLPTYIPNGWVGLKMSGIAVASFFEVRAMGAENVHTSLLESSEAFALIAEESRRWRYVRDELAQMHSPKMNNEHSWRFRPLYHDTGPTVDAAIDKAFLVK